MADGADKGAGSDKSAKGRGASAGQGSAHGHGSAHGQGGHGADPQASLSALMAEVWRRSLAVADAMIEPKDETIQIPDPGVVAKAFTDFGTRLFSDPSTFMKLQMDLWSQYAEVFEQSAKRFAGEPADPVVAAAKDDKRFKDKLWDEDPTFSLLKQSYLVTARWFDRAINAVDGMDPSTRRKLHFYARQLVDALAPTNFALTNPEVIRATLESHGENLVRGFGNYLEDLRRGKGDLAIRMTDETPFLLGQTIATTPGKVIHETSLAQLIHYAPATETQHAIPLLIVPPWINKYYILDLKPKNSLIKWLTDQGFSVFVISWANPDERLADKGFADYMEEGPLAAIDAIQKAIGPTQVHIVGYCIGGTLTAATLAAHALRKPKDRTIASATFFTTMLDFEEPGDLAVFIDEEQLELIDAYMHAKGFLDGRYMARVFSLLRDNDLIWSFVISNYLLGREPLPFDLLYWNGDSTRMPAMMHSFYLREMYLNNRLRQPGGITLGGTPVDLSRVTVPAYFVSTREDHIAPWMSTYAGARLLGGPVTFTLAGSGHIAGVVNPAVGGKYEHWVRPAAPTGAGLPPSPEIWLKDAQSHPGSWWPHWAAWLAALDGAKVPARIPGSGGLPAIEDAPGRYVAVRLDG